MRAYQKILPRIRAYGASLIAISPQNPDKSQSTLLKNFLEYTVLSDAGNRVAREFGLVYSLPETVRPIYRSLGINLPEFNDDNTWELPLPGTFVIDQQGVVRLSFVDSDYTKRLEPERILDCFASLENKRMILRD